jgi:hypothetical protein
MPLIPFYISSREVLATVRARTALWGLSTARLGFDHGVGHPFLLLGDAKAPNFRKNNAFNDLGHYSEWPKVADAVIKAPKSTAECYSNW